MPITTMSKERVIAKTIDCPFCGGEERGIHRTFAFSTPWAFQVRCLKCGALGPAKKILDNAIDAWNKRDRRYLEQM